MASAAPLTDANIDLLVDEANMGDSGLYLACFAPDKHRVQALALHSMGQLNNA